MGRKGPAAQASARSRRAMATMLSTNQPQATSTMVAPVAVDAQSWAETSRPTTAELTLITSAHQNMRPAERARLRAVAAGTKSSAVTSSTPTACTENMTIRARRPANRYWCTATRTRWACARVGLMPM